AEDGPGDAHQVGHVAALVAPIAAVAATSTGCAAGAGLAHECSRAAVVAQGGCILCNRGARRVAAVACVTAVLHYVLVLLVRRDLQWPVAVVARGIGRLHAARCDQGRDTRTCFVFAAARSEERRVW